MPIKIKGVETGVTLLAQEPGDIVLVGDQAYVRLRSTDTHDANGLLHKVNAVRLSDGRLVMLPWATNVVRTQVTVAPR